MLALIDGDIVAYRCAAVCENVDEGIARWQASELVERIISDVGADSWQIFISGDNNFRYAIYPDYKLNRRDKPKPKWLEPVREHLVTEWNAEIVDGYEADDALGINLTGIPDTVCCSIDKDLLQIPGRHYNFVKQELSTVLENEGWKNFYTQLLVGDTSDNIPGCPSIGAVKAPRLLAPCGSVWEMYQICLQAYMKQQVPIEIMHRNAQLLYVWRRLDDQWQIPTQKIAEQKPVAP
mgnify:CR=1 FL=1